MPYEIEFIGVGNKSKSNADAICFRWKEDNDYHIGVYDGGFSEYGLAMVEHLNRYYFGDKKDRKEKIIDFVIVSHSDQDHTAGLEEILKNFNVKKLYMNRPWRYVDDVFAADDLFDEFDVFELVTIDDLDNLFDNVLDSEITKE